MAPEETGIRRIHGGKEDDGFVEVVFAKSPVEASGCRDLLQEQNIPAFVESNAGVNLRSGIAVLVPSDRLVEASDLLATHPQEDDDFDGDDFEDEDNDALNTVGDDDYDDDYDDDCEDGFELDDVSEDDAAF